MVLSNQIYKGAEGRESLIDLEIPESFNGEIVIFIHGFMVLKTGGHGTLSKNILFNSIMAFVN